MSKNRETIENSRSLSGSDITFPTGLALLDQLVGGGMRQGFASGDVIRLLGESKAGKTYFIMELIAAAYHKFPKRKFKWLYDNVEGGFSFWNAPDLLGLPILDGNLISSKTPSEAFARYTRFLEELGDDEFAIIAQDSLDGFMGDYQKEQLKVKQENIIDGAGKKEKGALRAEIATYMSSTFFPGMSEYTDTTSPKRKNILYIFVSQMRDNPDASFGGRKPSGGNAAWYYPDVILELRRAQPVIRKDEVFKREVEVGSVARVALKKTRTPRPERSTYFTLWFDSGVQEIETNIDYIYGLRSDKGTQNKWGMIEGGETRCKVEWKGETITRQALIKMAEEDPAVEEELRKKAILVWEKVEASVASTRRRKYG